MKTHQITSHDMTWHLATNHITSPRVTSQPTALLHRSLQPTTSKQVTTSPPWNGWRLVHSNNSVWASQSLVTLCTFYRQILSLTYSFSSWKLPPPACPALLVTIVSKSPNWGCSPSKWLKLLINGGYYLLTGMILQVGCGFKSFEFKNQYFGKWSNLTCAYFSIFCGRFETTKFSSWILCCGGHKIQALRVDWLSMHHNVPLPLETSCFCMDVDNLCLYVLIWSSQPTPPTSSQQHKLFDIWYDILDDWREKFMMDIWWKGTLWPWSCAQLFWYNITGWCAIKERHKTFQQSNSVDSNCSAVGHRSFIQIRRLIHLFFRFLQGFHVQ